MQVAIEGPEDWTAIAAFRERLGGGEEELVPAEIANRIIDGESRVRVWREYRNLSARELAEKAEISAAYLSQIENGTRDGSFDTIKRIAGALGITVDDLA